MISRSRLNPQHYIVTYLRREKGGPLLALGSQHRGTVSASYLRLEKGEPLLALGSQHRGTASASVVPHCEGLKVIIVTLPFSVIVIESSQGRSHARMKSHVATQQQRRHPPTIITTV